MNTQTKLDSPKYQERKERVRVVVTQCTTKLLTRILKEKSQFDPDIVIASYFELKERGVNP